MSYNLAVWEGEHPRDDEHAVDVFEALRSLYSGDDPVPPTPGIKRYVQAMQARWPGPTAKPDDPSPFASGSLIDNVSGPLIFFGIRQEVVIEVGSDAAYVARLLGLVCYDPQHKRLITGSPVTEDPWVAVVSVDPDFFEAHGSADFDGELPAPITRRIDLAETRTRVGRYSRKQIVNPEIDLSVAPADPWVSRAHAEIVRNAAGAWSLVDLGSENGVYLNDSTTPLARKESVPLAAGDRIHVGRWTTITVGPASSI